MTNAYHINTLPILLLVLYHPQRHWISRLAQARQKRLSLLAATKEKPINKVFKKSLHQLNMSLNKYFYKWVQRGKSKNDFFRHRTCQYRYDDLFLSRLANTPVVRMSPKMLVFRIIYLHTAPSTCRNRLKKKALKDKNQMPALNHIESTAAEFSEKCWTIPYSFMGRVRKNESFFS